MCRGLPVSAVNADAAEFQVIELHAAHGYLLAQFLSAEAKPGAPRIGWRSWTASSRVIRASAPGGVVGVRLWIPGRRGA